MQYKADKLVILLVGDNENCVVTRLLWPYSGGYALIAPLLDSENEFKWFHSNLMFKHSINVWQIHTDNNNDSHNNSSIDRRKGHEETRYHLIAVQE